MNCNLAQTNLSQTVIWLSVWQLMKFSRYAFERYRFSSKDMNKSSRSTSVMKATWVIVKTGCKLYPLTRRHRFRPPALSGHEFLSSVDGSMEMHPSASGASAHATWFVVTNTFNSSLAYIQITSLLPPPKRGGGANVLSNQGLFRGLIM